MTATKPGECPNCHSEDPNIVGVERATGLSCEDPFHCPSPEAHGNPFRYCPHCNWTAAKAAAADTVTVRTLTFINEEELQEHAERLNESGKTPDVAIIDAKGVSVLACRTAPGGDGWGFEYYAPGEDGFMHCCGCSGCGPTCSARTPGWKPTFPVTALAVSSRFPC